jgi:serine/threonine protein kinase
LTVEGELETDPPPLPPRQRRCRAPNKKLLNLSLGDTTRWAEGIAAAQSALARPRHHILRGLRSPRTALTRSAEAIFASVRSTAAKSEVPSQKYRVQKRSLTGPQNAGQHNTAEFSWLPHYCWVSSFATCSPHNCSIKSYEIDSFIGESNSGFTGLVFTAHDETNSRVAVKIPKPNVSINVRVQQSWSREMRGCREAMALRCPHMIEILAVHSIECPLQLPHMTLGQRGDVFEFIVMELACTDLCSFLEGRRTFPPRLARHFFRQLLQGLAFLHDHNFVHRDIKPENLLLDRKLNLKIADFGIARRGTDARGFQSFVLTNVGTRHYLPPERNLNATRERVEDGTPQAGDVWMAGVTLYLMLTGAFAFGTGGVGSCALLRQLDGGENLAFWAEETAPPGIVPPKSAVDRHFS